MSGNHLSVFAQGDPPVVLLTNGRRVYSPIACHTASRAEGPAVDSADARHHSRSLVRFGRWEFTPDYTCAVEIGGPLDAPDFLPCGGVRGLSLADGSGVLLCAHTYREGRHA
jgi:hypothetical protein